MKAITITNTELRVNGYAVCELPNLGFDYVALYYEPECGNMFKVLSDGVNLYRVGLIATEVAACEAYCMSFVPPEVYEQAEPADVDDPVVTFVDEYGYLRGTALRSSLTPKQTEIPDNAVDSLKIYSIDMPVLVWDPNVAAFVGDSRGDRRLLEYYAQAKVGDQLDALWAFVGAFVGAGGSVPAKTADMMAILASIKSRNP